MEEILDFSKDLDVALLDNVVNQFYSGSGKQQQLAQQILTQFQESDEAWTRVDKILETSKLTQTKFIGLRILENLIQTKWKIIPKDQQNGIKNYVVETIIKNSTTEQSLRLNRIYLSKLNLILVQLLKQEWPENWPSFIPELVASSKTNIYLCENNMEILKLLSEEIFDFSAEQITQSKAAELKERMATEFSGIFQLCIEIFKSAVQPSLVRATLETFLRFLSWLPLGYIFDTDFLHDICSRFLEARETRNQVFKCLTEVSSFHVEEKYNAKMVSVFNMAMGALEKTIGSVKDFKTQWDDLDPDEQEFIQNSVLFLTAFLGNQLKLVEGSADINLVVRAHEYIVRIMRVDDREIYKVCLEYCNSFVKTLYEDSLSTQDKSLLNLSSSMKRPRHDKYEPVLSSLRLVIIDTMAKPEEVLIVENDDGEIVREFIKETDTLTLYKSQRECLVFLTHLNPEDMESIIMTKLTHQLDQSEWSWNNLNSLCWAFGSISGAMKEDQERKFLVLIIKGLLSLCEFVKGKDNKAVVASNIMYVVGQYPRFLKAHWKFLKTVANKLFEFMHELHPGVRDMACDTFITIADNCKHHFVVQQPDEFSPFINEIIANIDSITSDLEPQQVNTFFNALSRIIVSQTDLSIRSMLITEEMRIPNMTWNKLLQTAMEDPSNLDKPETNKALLNVLKINSAACEPVGSSFLPQLAIIFLDMLSIYTELSIRINNNVALNGEIAARYANVRSMLAVKKEILHLIETFVSKCTSDDVNDIHKNIVFPLFSTIMGEYSNSSDSTRISGILTCLTTIVKVLGNVISDQTQIIFESVMLPTLNMINKDFSEFPDHRAAFFALLEQINSKLFIGVILLPPDHFKLFVDSIVWGFKHTTRDISDSSLMICMDLINNFAGSDQNSANTFFKMYYISLLQDILFVLTDSDHKSGFTLQCRVLYRLIEIVRSSTISNPLYDERQPFTSNSEYVYAFIFDLLSNAFPNLNKMQVKGFVTDVFELNTDFEVFKSAIRDFLINLKVFSGDNDALFIAERERDLLMRKKADRRAASQIPGLLKPSEMEQEI
ncbi:hypothetical protein BB560_006659 [Smittium megazygosporum]|uniref:Exportin-1 n=1 Tax=Smittium megazygosporum TaxID=133381 RepID=A0A2T9Y2N7_9FUNG|nr:hypothetical protein BB560_006659 [Smittium megazygosporum]